MRSALLGTLLALVFPVVASAASVAPPQAALVMDDGNSIVPIFPVENEDGTFQIENWHFQDAELEVTLSVFFDPDPVILYASSVVDFGAPSSFGFIFSQAILPTSAPGLADHTHSSSTTGFGGSTTPVTALAPPVAPPVDIPVDADGIAEIAVFTLSTDGGATFLSAGLDLSPSFVGAAGSDIQGPFAEGPIAGPAGSGSYDLMRVDLNFGMAGGNDAYTFNGQARIVAPEPASSLLMGLGLAGLALARRLTRL